MRWLSYAWLVEAALLARLFRVFFGDIGHTGGPGTGGLILVVPFALLALALAPLCALVAYGLHQGSGLGIIKVMSGLGLGAAALVAVPLAVVIALVVFLFVMSGYALEGFALVALPLLFLATLVVLHRGAQPQPSLGAFFFAAGIALVSALFPRSQRAPVQPPAPVDRAPFEKAIRADDPAPLANPQVWNASFYLEGKNTDGDALKLAIVLDKPKAARALAAQHRGDLWAYTGDAMRWGTPAVWDALLAEKAPLANDEGIHGAIDHPGLDAIEWLLAHGAPRQKLLAQAEAAAYVPDQAQKIAWLKK